MLSNADTHGRSIFYARVRGGALLLSSLLVSTTVLAQSGEEWLARMTNAVEASNYRGKIMRNQGGKVEFLRVVHKYENGEVSEMLSTMDGVSRTIIRDADGVRCIFPESKSVLIEKSSSSLGLFHRIPLSMNRLAAQYDVIKVRENERIADRETVLIAVRPRDEYRYGHRVWLERESALPLKTELLDESGRVIEEIRFVDFRLEDTIPSSDFELGIDIAGFRFIGGDSASAATASERPVSVDEKWTISKLPMGYSVTQVTRTGQQRHHLRIDDGMASVSVFIEPPEKAGSRGAAVSKMLPAHAYSVWSSDRQITAVGEVPMRTVKQIAESVALASSR